METEGKNIEPESYKFNKAEVLRNNPMAQIIAEACDKFYGDMRGENYNKMVGFIQKLQAEKLNLDDSLYYHLLVGSTPWYEPKKLDLEDEDSIVKFVQSIYPELFKEESK